MIVADRTNKLVDKIVSSINNYSDLKVVKQIVDSTIKPVLEESGYTLDKGSKLEGISGSEYGGSARAFASGGKEKTFRYIIEVRDDIPEEKKENILYHEFVHLVQMINVAIQHGDKIKDQYRYSWLDLETIAKPPKNYKDDSGYYKDTQEIAAHAYETATRLKDKAKELGVAPKTLLSNEGVDLLDDEGLKYYMREAAPKVRRHFIKLVSEALTKTAKVAKFGEVYDYSSTQLILDPKTTDYIQDFINNNIDKNDLTGNGLGDQTHITLLYGIQEPEDDGRLEKAVKESGLRSVTFKGLDKFSNETDVLLIKIDKSKELVDTEKRLRELYPDNKNTFDEYIPHCTLAYLKPGTADKYIKKFNDLFAGKEATVDAVEFSASGGGGLIRHKIAASEEEFIQLVCNYVEKNYLKFQVTDKKTLGYKEIIAKLEANLNITEELATLLYPIVEQRVQLTLNKQGFKQALKKLLNGPAAKKHEPKLSSFAEDVHIIFQKIKKPIRDAAKGNSKAFLKVLKDQVQNFRPVVGLDRIDIKPVETYGFGDRFLTSARINNEKRWMILDVDLDTRGVLNTFEGWNQFQDQMEEYMSHEFQHQVDFDEGKSMPGAEYQRALDEGYYYELPDEMHSYARQAVSELRNKGYTDPEIIDLIDRGKVIELANNSLAFDSYVKHKDDDPELYRDFTLLVINHIKKDTNKFMGRRSNLLKKRAELIQEYDSAATSLDQIAAVFKKVNWRPDTVNIDYGGGRFDKATDFLKDKGVENLVYDPFNRSSEHNATVIGRLKKKKADTGTLANVLNVIKEKDVRLSVLHELKSLVKPGGEVYISVYYDPKQKAKPTSKGWQNHLPLTGYLDEISSVFSSIKVSNGMIIAKV